MTSESSPTAANYILLLLSLILLRIVLLIVTVALFCSAPKITLISPDPVDGYPPGTTTCTGRTASSISMDRNAQYIYIYLRVVGKPMINECERGRSTRCAAPTKISPAFSS